MRRIVLTSLASGLIFVTSATVLAAETAKPTLGTWGVEIQNINPAIKPGDDFYRYVNDGWLKTAKPPAGLAYANGFIDAYLKTQTRLQTLVDEIAKSKPAPGSDEQLVGALVQSYIDKPRRNQLGLAPIKADLDAILAIQSRDEIGRWMARPFVASFMGVGVGSDEAKPQRYVLHVQQAGLGLPSPEYYLLAAEPYAGHKIAYRAYIDAAFQRAGISESGARADAIVALETAIAATYWTPTELRDPVRTYHLMTTDALDAYAPGFPWAVNRAEAGFADQHEIVLSTDTAVQKLAKLFADTPVETLRSYIAFHFIDNFAPALSDDWENANFAFYGARLAGTPEQQAINNRAIAFAGKILGEVVGHLYVKRYFPAEHRAMMEQLVANLRASFQARLEANPWMDAATREQALLKLAGVTRYIGYPDRWRDYSAVVLDPADLVGNWRKLAEFERLDSIKAIGESRRDWQWHYPAHEINAGYAPSFNSITFPAGILQSPFFDAAADPAVNYGSIGAVIGHELGHAFDDQGSQTDATGTLRNWWTPAARAEFSKRTAVLVEQFNAFVPLPGMHVNGSLTLGENIGDLGGLTIAFDAYRLFVQQQQGGAAPVIDGFSGDQRFLLAWGQLWRDYTAPDTQRTNVLTDAHSPSEFRVNGPMRNFDPWYAAFGVKPGDALYLAPEKRVKIW